MRRRLFEDASGAARTDIAAVARRFTQFYAENRREFPSQVAEAEYERRIIDCYPLHPELFDRLYDDWSTLERFQRTRGVLRLMSTVIYALWHANDAYPLIMPATVPLSEPRVFDDLTQYLEDSWKSIIDSDVDGPSALPARIDHDRPVFGQRALTQRLARTIFLGSAATLRSAHKGIGQHRIWLGTAVPGDTHRPLRLIAGLARRPGHLPVLRRHPVLVRHPAVGRPRRQGRGRPAPRPARRGLGRDRRPARPQQPQRPGQLRRRDHRP